MKACASVSPVNSNFTEHIMMRQLSVDQVGLSINNRSCPYMFVKTRMHNVVLLYLQDAICMYL